MGSFVCGGLIMIHYESSYFNGEYVDDFFVEAKMKHAWAAQIEVMEQIRRVCDKHSIKFFADWGTLLGAVRHKGYIPWDDDLDLGMLRDDYERFIQVAQNELEGGLVLKSLYNDSEHDNVICRVVSGKSMNFDKEYLKRYHNCPYVVGVDIFPIDYITRDDEKLRYQLDMINLMMKTVASIPENPPYDEDVLQLIKSIEEVLNVKLDKSNRIRHELKKQVDLLCGMYGAKDSDEVCSMLHLALVRDYRIKKESYEKVIEMPFENTTIPVPAGYDEILRVKYSDNYMTPRKGGGSHEYPFYKKQEQGLADVINEEFGITISKEELDELIRQKIYE